MWLMQHASDLRVVTVSFWSIRFYSRWYIYMNFRRHGKSQRHTIVDVGSWFVTTYETACGEWIIIEKCTPSHHYIPSFQRSKYQ